MKKQIFFLVLVFIIFLQFVNAQVPSYVPTNGLVGYWGFSGNANDSSVNGNNGTVTGATLTTDRFGNANSAYHFNGNGSNNSISVASPVNIPIGNQSRTFSVWIRTNSTYWGRTIIEHGGSASTLQELGTGTNGGTNINYFGGLNAGTYPNNLITSNQWVHFVAMYDSTTSTTKIYCNGVLVTTQILTTPFNTTQGTLWIGKKSPLFITNAGDDYVWQGELDDISIYNRTLSETEIQQLYTGTVIVASCPSLSGTLTNGLVAYYPFCGNANDASGSNNNGTVNGATLTADRFGNANSAYSFDGTSNYIRCVNAGVTGSNSRSVAFWIKTNSTSPGSIISYGNSDSSSQDFRVILHGLGISCGANTDMACTITGSGRGIQYASNNTWDFFTIVYDNTLSTNLLNVKIYKNGILATSYCDENITNSLNTGSTNPLTIGCYHWLSYSGNKQYFSGTLDDIGLWNRALTPDEVLTLYGQNICYQSVTVTDTLIISTGILSYNPISYNNTITIYPNPANDHITIDCGTLTNVVGYSIKITNTLGQEVFNQPMNTQQYYVALNSWTGQGVYFVNIIDAQGHTIDVRKIILQ